jgi:hypothetical protein
LIFKKLQPFFKKIGPPGIAVAGFTFLLYAALFERRVLLDITAQVQTLVKWTDGQVSMPPTALFYLLTWLCAGFQSHFVLLMGGALLALTLLSVAKWWATRDFLSSFFPPSTLHLLPSSPQKNLGWLAASLLLVCALPTPDWWLRGSYLMGQPSPNYWMNGTVLASWPFAVVLFGQSLRQLERGPEVRWAKWLAFWLLCLVLSKPSFALVFGVVYPIFLVRRFGWRAAAVRCQLLALAGLPVLLGAEYFLVFLEKSSVYVRDFNAGRASGVVISPLTVWRHHSSNLLLSVLCSVAFPLAVSVTWWRTLRRATWFWYAWVSFGVAMGISGLLMQTGEEWYTWAFRFQNYLAAYLLFVVCAGFGWQQMGHKIIGPRRIGMAQLTHSERVVVIGYLLHLLSGVVYLAKMWITRSHY